jgi:hypothetical protein
MLAGGDKDAQREALKAANKGWDKPPTPPAPVTTTTTMTRTVGAMPPRPMGMGMGMGMGMAPSVADSTTMPVFEDGDPTHRNFRND